jgi:hypothetical protein
MRQRWRSLLLVLLVAEVVLAAWCVRIQPRCEPCRAGDPCPPCISRDQERILAVAGLLPLGLLAAQLLVLRGDRRKP